MRRMGLTVTSAAYITMGLATLLLVGTASATCTKGASGDCEVGNGKTYATIQACADAATAGQTCRVFAGTYNVLTTASNSGAGTNGVCSACITFKVNSGDSVTTGPWTIAGSYVIVTGFTITDPTFTLGYAGVYIDSGMTGVQILDNTITQVGRATSGQTSSGYSCVSMQDGPSHYTTIKGNKISWCSSLSSQINVPGGNPHMSAGIVVLGDHILVQGNDISHVIDGIRIGGNTTIVAVIGNNYHDSYIGLVDGNPPNGEHDSLGCIETNNCDTHIDFIEAVGGGNTNVLVDGNSASTLWGTAGAHIWFVSSQTATDTHWISRFTKAYQIGSAYLANEAFTSSPYGVTYWKDYNNSYIVSQTQSTNQVFSACGQNGANGSFLNNLFYNDANPPGNALSYYSWGSSCLPANIGHNLAFDSTCKAATLVGCASGQMASDKGNIYADPMLVATDGTSFALQTISPALGAGTYLTTVANTDSGSGTSLVINDAAYFQDGYGIPGVHADWIRVGPSTTVQITNVNYSTNTLTLANPISRSAGNPVYLYKDSSGNVVLTGANPNIGAGLDPSQVVVIAPPTGLSATVN